MGCMESPIWLPEALRCITRERSVEKRYLALRTAVIVGLKRLVLRACISLSLPGLQDPRHALMEPCMHLMKHRYPPIILLASSHLVSLTIAIRKVKQDRVSL